MPGLYRRLFVLFLCGLFFWGALGCTKPPETAAPEYIIRAGSTIIFPDQFAEELDLKLAAYPYTLKKNPVEYNRIVFDLVLILSEESVLLAAAKDKGIQVTDSELDAAVAVQREDYPEDSFEQMLLENAVSYPHWKKNLKKNLIIDTFIQQELKDQIEILPEDVVSFYKRHVDQEMVADEKKLVSHLRREKSQESYGEWIKELKTLYPVEINKIALTKFLIEMDKNKGHVND